MRPAAFELHRPASLEAALGHVAAGAVPLAGGQSLLPAMRLRDATPTALVDLSTIAELDDAIVIADGWLRLGAHVTHRQVAEHTAIGSAMPWIAAAAQQLGDVQVRNLGTTLGNLCWADPRANMAVALLASDAAVIVAAPGGQRTRLPLGEFFTGFRRHALGERIAMAIELPWATDARGVYLEFSRQPQDLALVNVCAVRRGVALSVAVGGIDPVPVRLDAVERDGPAALDAALRAADHAPVVDQHGDAAYKLHLARVLAELEVTP
ncbi:MAG: xanthine dehydrogenase family protein subunit M [Gammaproteobacteria bacterium]